jgi:hypothetical protein
VSSFFPARTRKFFSVYRHLSTVRLFIRRLTAASDLSLNPRIKAINSERVPGMLLTLALSSMPNAWFGRCRRIVGAGFIFNSCLRDEKGVLRGG